MAGQRLAYGTHFGGRQFALSGPGPEDMPVLTANGLYFNGKKLKSARDFHLYDTWRVKAGTALPTASFKFFVIPLGSAQAGLNFATTYTKTEIDTTMEQAGMLPRDTVMRVDSIQVRILITGATDTTYPASGIGTELPSNPAPAAIVSAPNEEHAILEGGWGQLHVGTKDYEKGKLIHFPAEYGMSGFAGGGRDDEVDNVAIANNGFGRCHKLTVKRWIGELRNFYFEMAFPYAITPNRNFTIEVCLDGVLWDSVQ